MALFSTSTGLRFGSKTPVSILQEILLRKGMIPHYELIHNGVGTHDPQFKYQLQAGEFTGIGIGKSKKEAKHDAAHTVLKKMHYDKALTDSAHQDPGENIDIQSPYSGAVKENVVGLLADLCMLNYLPSPEYIPIREEGPPHARVFTFLCSLSTTYEIAVARTKKQAKHMVSQQMINRLTTILGDKLVPVPEKTLDPDTDEPEIPLLMIEGMNRSQYNLGLPLSKYHEFISEAIIDMEPVAILEDLKTKDLNWLMTYDLKEQIVIEIGVQLHLKTEILVGSCGTCTKPDTIESWNNDFESPLEENVRIIEHNGNDSGSDADSSSDCEEATVNSNDAQSDEEKKYYAKVIFDSSPPRIFFSFGDSIEDARIKALTSALIFYYMMVQSSFPALNLEEPSSNHVKEFIQQI